MHPSLGDLQKLVCRLITAPNGVEEGLRSGRNLPPDGIGSLIGGDSGLSAIEREQFVPVPVRQRRSIIAWRKNCDVSYRALNDIERRALANIRCGNEFKLVCEAIAAEIGDAAAPALTSTMLSRWLADGILVRL